MVRACCAAAIITFVLSPQITESQGQIMAYDPDPPPIYSVRFVDPSLQDDPLYMTYVGINCTKDFDDPSWAGYCIGSYKPDSGSECGWEHTTYLYSLSQLATPYWQQPWQAFGSFYYQDVTCLGHSVEHLPLFYDNADDDSSGGQLELPTHAAKLQAIEGLDSLHEIPLEVYNSPAPPVAAARYHITIPGHDSNTPDTKSGVLVWLSAFYDPAVFKVEVTHATFDPNTCQGGNCHFKNITRSLDNGRCTMFRPRGSSVFAASDPNAPIKDPNQHLVPTSHFFDTTYRRRGWIKIALRNGVSIRDVAGRTVRLRVHTLNWVGSMTDCPGVNAESPFGPTGGDRWSYRLTDETDIGVSSEGQTEGYSPNSPTMTDESLVDTITSAQRKAAGDVPVVNLVNEMNAVMPSLKVGHCKWKAAKTLNNTLGNVAYYHRYSTDFSSKDDVVRMNLGGVWFCDEDVPNWFITWRCYGGFFYLQVVDPIGNVAYTYLTDDKACWLFSGNCENWIATWRPCPEPDGVTDLREYFDDYAYLVDIDYDPNSGQFPGPGDRFFDYNEDLGLISQEDYNGNRIDYQYLPNGNQLTLNVTGTSAQSGGGTRSFSCTFGKEYQPRPDYPDHLERDLSATSYVGTTGGSRQYSWYPPADPNDANDPNRATAGKLKTISDHDGTILRQCTYDSRGRLIRVTRGQAPSQETIAEYDYQEPNDANDPNDWPMTARHYVDDANYQGVTRWFDNAENSRGVLKRMEEFHTPGCLSGTASVTHYTWDTLNSTVPNRRTTSQPSGIKQVEVFDPNKQNSLMETYWAEAPDATEKAFHVKYGYQRRSPDPNDANKPSDPNDPNFPDWGIWQKTAEWDLSRDANTTWRFDNWGFLTRRDDPVANQGSGTLGYHSYQAFTYQPNRKLVATELRNSGQGDTVTTTLGYDAYDNVTSRTESCQGQQRQTRFTFNAFGQETSRTDPDGIRTVKEYWPDTGLLQFEYTCAGPNDANAIRETQYHYADGRLSEVWVADRDRPFVHGSLNEWIKTHYNYDLYGHVTTRTVSRPGEPNATWSYEYDRQDRITKITYPDGTFERLIRDGRGLVTAQEIGHGGSTVVWTNTYQYDLNGNLIYRTCQSSSSVAATTEYVYDRYNRRKAEIQHNTPDNACIGREFLTNNTTHSTNADVIREYTGTAEGTGIQRDIRYQIDNLGRAWQTRQLTTPGTLDNARDRITTLTYDQAGNVLTETVAGDTDDGGNAVTTHTYDWRNFRLSTLNPGDTQAITCEYDQRGNVLTETTPIRTSVSNKAVHTYDGAGRRTRTINKENDTARLQVDFTYDSRGHKTQQTSRDPATQQILAQERWEFDAQGNQSLHARMADATRATPSNQYDQVTRRTYDLMSRLLTETTYGEAGGANVSRTTTYTRDALGRLTLTTDPLNNTDTSTQFGRGSQVTARTLTDSIGSRTFTYQYDSLGRLLGETETVGGAAATTLHQYDTAGRQIETTDPLGTKTSTTYDGLDQEITVVRDAGSGRLNQTVTKVYTQLGHLKSETANDGTANQVTTYAHDKQGRRTDVWLPDAGHWHYALDWAGRTTARTDPNGTVIEYTRNWRGQELTKTLGGTTVETFQYDTLGRMTGAARDAGNQVTIAYDALGCVSSETQTVQNVPKTFTYTWHACGTLNTAIWADGNLDPNIGSFSYWHDALDNVTQIRRAGRPQVMYEWSGRRWKHRSVWLDPYQVQVLFTLAERNAPGRRITALNHSGRSDVFKEGFSYTRDALGDPNRIDRTGVLSAERSVDYLYDGLHRVTAASYDDGTNEAFALDTLGNRTGYLGRDANAVAYEHNTVNEYTSIAPGTAPQYSGTGNLTRDERGFKYAYDYENRLTEIKAPDDTLLAQYVYDPLGRRAAEVRYDQGPPLVMRYYFAVGPIGGSGPGQNLALEYKGLYGQVLERYTVHGATYIDEVAFFHDGPKNKDYACELNDTYSVVGLVGQDGRLLRAYEYDVYGRRREINTHWDFLIGLRNHLGASPTGDLAKYDVNDDGNIDLRDLTKARIPPELPGVQPWGFQGRIRLSYKTPGASPQTLTVYDFRARFYEPTHGRFLQRDPAEYADSYNLYLAMLGNPVIAADPSGEFSLLDLNITWGLASQLESSKSDPYKSLLTSVKGFVGIVNARNQMLGDLLDMGDMGDSGKGIAREIDTLLAIWDNFQQAQNTLLVAGILKAGTQFTKEGMFAFKRAGGHHGIPRFMGGADEQILYYGKSYKRYHVQFHATLREAMKKAEFPYENIGRPEFMNWLREHPGSQERLFRLVKKTARKFDAENDTDFLAAFMVNFFGEHYTRID